MNYQQYIPLIVEELKKAEPEKIILFGSYAYGEPNDDSDIDLMVIKDLPPHKIREYRLGLKKALWNLFEGVNFEFDLLVDNEERIQQRIALGDLFYKDIITKGKVIYA
jgi:predicted nucleotidyltransferase